MELVLLDMTTSYFVAEVESSLWVTTGTDPMVYISVSDPDHIRKIRIHENKRQKTEVRLEIFFILYLALSTLSFLVKLLQKPNQKYHLDRIQIQT